MPGALIADRTALEFKPSTDGSLFVVSDRKRVLELPGVIVRPRKGPPPLVDIDLPFIGTLYQSSDARAYLDNMVPLALTLRTDPAHPDARRARGPARRQDPLPRRRVPRHTPRHRPPDRPTARARGRVRPARAPDLRAPRHPRGSPRHHPRHGPSSRHTLRPQTPGAARDPPPRAARRGPDAPPRPRPAAPRAAPPWRSSRPTSPTISRAPGSRSTRRPRSRSPTSSRRTVRRTPTTSPRPGAWSPIPWRWPASRPLAPSCSPCSRLATRR
jgi:hypothetical protein